MTPFHSNAQSSQGSAIYIAQKVAPGGEGDLDLTAITQAAPPNVTSAGHSLLSGDIGAFSGVGGMVEINGMEAAVENADTDTFDAFGIDASGFTAYTSGGTFTPYNMLKVCEARDASFPGGQASEIDVSTLCSTAREVRLGLQDFGDGTMNINFVLGDPALVELQAAAADAQPRWFKIVFPDGAGTAVFQAYVRQLGFTIGVNQAIQGSVSLRITGPISFIDVVPPAGVALASVPVTTFKKAA